jgi:homoserine kinase type II
VATYTSVSDAALEAFLAAYGLSATGFGGIPEGSVNSNYWVECGKTRLFLRIFEEQDAEGAQAEASLLDHLAGAGVPTPPPVRDRDGAPVGVLAGKPAALFPWRSGRARCQASVTGADAERLGATLGKLHRVPNDHPAMRRGPGRFRRSDLANRIERISADEQFGPLAERLWEALEETDRERVGDLPRGLIHGDLFRDNVLFDESGEIVALLDFESAFEGAYVYDLAVCVLSWCFGDGFEPALMAAVARGYEAVRPLGPAERVGLYGEMRFAALRFTVTRITDFAMRTGHGDSLRVMKDYGRFLARFERVGEWGRAALDRVMFASS